MKEKINPNHHMGKHSGYELINGEYRIAPVYQDQFAAVRRKSDAVDKVILVVTNQAAEEFEELAKISGRIWDELCDDLGLDRNGEWTYQNGIVKLREQKK